MVSACGYNRWSILWYYSSVGKGLKSGGTGWQIISKWSGVSVSYGWCSSNDWSWSGDGWSGDDWSSNSWGSCNNGTSSGVSSTCSSEVISSGG